MAEREVVLHGIVRIEAPKRRGDLLGGAPARVVSLGEAEVLGDAMHVRVDGHHELGRRERPEAEVHAVGGARHPAAVEKKPLAGAARAGIRDEVAESARVGSRTAERGGHARQPFAEAVLARQLGEAKPDAAVRPAHRSHPRQRAGQLRAPVDAVHEAFEGARPRRLAD